MACKARDLAAAVRAAAVVVAEHRVELIDLDRAIGDGDHGENMNRGFAAVVAALDAGMPETPGGVLKLTATTLISKVGGAAGPLYGTAFLRAATKLGDVAEVDAQHLAARLVGRHSAFGSGHHKIFDADIRKCPARHHPIISAPRPVAVEILNGYPMIEQVLAGR